MNCETYYLNLLHNRGGFYSNFNKYLELNNGSGYQKLINLCNTRESYSKKLNFEGMLHEHFCGGLNIGSSILRISFNKLILLTSYFIAINKYKINEFLEFKSKFEQYILTKDYKAAHNVLMQVYVNFGMSLWLIDSSSILISLEPKEQPDFVEQFTNLEKAYFDVFELKNNIRERHGYYVKKMSEMFNTDKFSREQVDFLQYLLFVSVPSSDSQWLNVIRSTYSFSFIDMYIAIDLFFLRTNIDNDDACKKSFEEVTNIKYINETEYYRNIKNAEDDAITIMDLFNKNKFDSVITSFFSNESKYYNYFGAYKLVALSYMFISDSLNNPDVLSAYIIYLMCLILKKDELSTVSAVNNLVSIARLMRTFQIHKGLCIFLDTIAGYQMETLFCEQIVTNVDYKYISNEFESENALLFPIQTKTYKIKEKQISHFFENFENLTETFPDALYYLKEAYLKHQIDHFLQNSQTIEATKAFVLAYSENKLLVFLLNPKEIANTICDKINNKENLSLEELCYVFIDEDDIFVNERRNCFLNYFDQSFIDEPLELIKNMENSEPMVSFFLNKVCSKEMLPNLYRKFKSTESVENYRLKICEFLIEKGDLIDKKEILAETEKITKSKALSKKLKQVEKSRITINTDFIKTNCFDEINDEVYAYNVTPAEFKYVTAIIDGMPVIFTSNRHNLIMKNMYDIYAKEFCFGDQGIDLSLSTRVRHGAFSNQILKAFTDNNLEFDGHGKNDYFDERIENLSIGPEVCKEFLDFSSKTKERLDYFTQHTLKVVFDKQIENAVFRYDFDDFALSPLYERFHNVAHITFDDVIFEINDLLLRKTNEYLTIIKNYKLPSLLEELLNDINDLSVTLKKYILNSDEEKNTERLIVNCKTDVQKSFGIISEWFSLTEYNNWEDYSFNELVETCQEIIKSLFIGFGSVSLNCYEADSLIFKGETFRDMVDVLLIMFNNSIIHSGYKEQLQDLNANIDLSTDSNSLYFSFENNLSKNTNFEELDQKIKKINLDFNNKAYLQINTRQEGGMGFYKIMHAVFSVLKLGNNFYVSRTDDTFRVEIRMSKEILVDEKNINC